MENPHQADDLAALLNDWREARAAASMAREVARDLEDALTHRIVNMGGVHGVKVGGVLVRVNGRRRLRLFRVLG